MTSQTTTTAPPDIVPEVRLTALDRCDTCGAQAYIEATVNGTGLLFCAHHASKYKEKLAATAIHWHDESARLLDVAAE